MKRLLFLMPVLLLVGCSKPDPEIVYVKMTTQEMKDELDLEGYHVLTDEEYEKMLNYENKYYDYMDFEDRAYEAEEQLENSNKKMREMWEHISYMYYSDSYISLTDYFEQHETTDVSFDEAHEAFSGIDSDITVFVENYYDD